MRYLILSDIHANLEALEASLAGTERWDHVLVLGDLIGYGADPNAVVEPRFGGPLRLKVLLEVRLPRRTRP